MADGRPVVAIDAAIPDAPLESLSDIAEVVRFSGDRELGELAGVYGERIAGLGLLLTTSVDDARLSALPGLRIVANCAVGHDNVDLEAAAACGVVVTNTPDVLTAATADLTWALILAVARRLPEGIDLIRSGEWSGWDPRELLGKSLTGATLAVLGAGRIGAAVARRAPAFGLDVVYWSRSRKPDLERETGARQVSLDEAIRTADIVSVHLPLTPETRHLVNSERIGRMKPDAVLVNTARGPIVDEAALAEALSRGHLMGAGLDVYDDEPRVHPRLLASPRAVLLPHIGSATREARDGMAALMAENLAAVLRGQPALTPVASGPPR